MPDVCLVGDESGPKEKGSAELLPDRGQPRHLIVIEREVGYVTMLVIVVSNYRLDVVTAQASEDRRAVQQGKTTIVIFGRLLQRFPNPRIEQHAVGVRNADHPEGHFREEHQCALGSLLQRRNPDAAPDQQTKGNEEHAGTSATTQGPGM